MEGFVSIEKTLKEADPSTTSHLIHRMVEQTVCPICQDHMFVPFMTKCGHNFCYECLSNWLNEHETCPACRGLVDVIPHLNVALQDLCDAMYKSMATILKDTPQELQREREMKIGFYKKDLEKNDLFNSVFSNMGGMALVDEDDGVQRCSNCHWEIDGDRCPNCHARVRRRDVDVGYDDYDSEVDSLYDDSIPYTIRVDSGDDDEEDSSDAGFLDDREDHLIEVHSDDDLLLSDASSPVRRPPYFDTHFTHAELHPWEDRLSSPERSPYEQEDEDPRSDYSSWNGFEEGASQMQTNHFNYDDSDMDSDDDGPIVRNRARRLVIDDDDDDDEESP